MRSILLIEEHVAILENLKEYLELEGYFIFSAANKKKGTVLAVEFIPDLVICALPWRSVDIQQDFTLLINTMISFRIPFIFSSTESDAVNRWKAMELGADDYMIKPFELDNMLEIIKNCMKDRN